MKRLILLLSYLAFILTACAPAGKTAQEETTAAPEAASSAPAAVSSTPTATPAAESASDAVANDIAADAGDAVAGVRIPLSALDGGVLFIDCASGDTAMQILARVNADGEPGLAWNTCQTCAGSPAAFFALDGGQLTCQNCGNRFSLDTVGVASRSSCMPWPLQGAQLQGDEIVIPQSVIDEMAAAFRNWRAGL